MVEMKIFLASALCARTFVAFPNFKLYRGGNDSIVIENGGAAVCDQALLINNLQPELEYLSTCRSLLPCINESEQAVIRPYTVTNLLEHSDLFRIGSTQLVAADRIQKEAVLGESPACQELRLIDFLGLRTSLRSRDVVTFVDYDAAALLEPVAVRSAPSEAH